jgi:hypothetical protein
VQVIEEYVMTGADAFANSLIEDVVTTGQNFRADVARHLRHIFP